MNINKMKPMAVVPKLEITSNQMIVKDTVIQGDVHIKACDVVLDSCVIGGDIHVHRKSDCAVIVGCMVKGTINARGARNIMITNNICDSDLDLGPYQYKLMTKHDPIPKKDLSTTGDE